MKRRCLAERNGMILLFVDEGVLRERFPEIPWDQPVLITIPDGARLRQFWCCRQCIALVGVKAQGMLSDDPQTGVFPSRQEALDHIERAHHD